MPGSGECNTHSVVNTKEPDAALNIAPHQGQQDDVILFSLIVVYCCCTHSFKLQDWHLLPELKQLTRVCCQDGDLFWFILLFEKISAEFNQEF